MCVSVCVPLPSDMCVHLLMCACVCLCVCQVTSIEEGPFISVWDSRAGNDTTGGGPAATHELVREGVTHTHTCTLTGRQWMHGERSPTTQGARVYVSVCRFAFLLTRMRVASQLLPSVPQASGWLQWLQTSHTRCMCMTGGNRGACLMGRDRAENHHRYVCVCVRVCVSVCVCVLCLAVLLSHAKQMSTMQHVCVCVCVPTLYHAGIWS